MECFRGYDFAMKNTTMCIFVKHCGIFRRESGTRTLRWSMKRKETTTSNNLIFCTVFQHNLNKILTVPFSQLRQYFSDLVFASSGNQWTVRRILWRSSSQIAWKHFYRTRNSMLRHQFPDMPRLVDWRKTCSVHSCDMYTGVRKDGKGLQTDEKVDL